MKEYQIEFEVIDRTNYCFGQRLKRRFKTETVGQARIELKKKYPDGTIDNVKIFECEPCPHCGHEMMKEVIA